MLLKVKDPRVYSHYVGDSVDMKGWTRVADRTKEARCSWQILKFEPLPVVSSTIFGTHNTANEVRTAEIPNQTGYSLYRCRSPSQRRSLRSYPQHSLPSSDSSVIRLVRTLEKSQATRRGSASSRNLETLRIPVNVSQRPFVCASSMTRLSCHSVLLLGNEDLVLCQELSWFLTESTPHETRIARYIRVVGTRHPKEHPVHCLYEFEDWIL